MNSRLTNIARLMVAAWLMVAAPGAYAHKPSDAYLHIVQRAGHTPTLRWDISLRDLSVAMTLDDNGDDQLSRAEVQRHLARIQSFATDALGVDGAGESCRYRDVRAVVVARDGEPHIRLTARLHCAPGVRSLVLHYRLFEQLDRDHRGILTSGAQTIVLRPGGAAVGVALPGTATASGSDVAANHRNAMASAVQSGVHHLLIGWDHLAFLLALMMGACYQRSNRHWAVAGTVHHCLRRSAALVTGFTIGHSVTLALATIGLVSLPSRGVEAVIGASIVAAVLTAVRSGRRNDNVLLAVGFGLIHGFGFAAVLDGAGVSGTRMIPNLLGFNLGVELGQLAVLALLLPMLWAIGRKPGLLKLAAPSAYAALLSLGVFWTVQRTF